VDFSSLRSYWSAVLLLLAAIVLLGLGAPTKEALAGAGFALFGAAVTRGIDLAKERGAQGAQADATRRKDLDETRRVAYIALVGRTTLNPDLVATLVNALAYHGSGVDSGLAARHVANIVNGTDGKGDSERWLRGHIDRITAELDGR
jgi:hypothetical protein